MAATVQGLKSYLNRPDDPADFSIYLNAAKSKARAAGLPDYKSNAQYDLFLYAVAAVYYDCRGTDMSAVDSNVQRMVNSFVLELRGAGEDPDEAGGGESEG